MPWAFFSSIDPRKFKTKKSMNFNQVYCSFQWCITPLYSMLFSSLKLQVISSIICKRQMLSLEKKCRCHCKTQKLSQQKNSQDAHHPLSKHRAYFAFKHNTPRIPHTNTLHHYKTFTYIQTKHTNSKKSNSKKIINTSNHHSFSP